MAGNGWRPMGGGQLRPSFPRRPGSGRDLGSGRRPDGPDQQIEGSYLGEGMVTPDQLALDRSHRGAVAVQVSFVPVNEPQRVFPNGTRGPRSSSSRYCLHDAVEHGDQRWALSVQRLCHLRETDPTDAGKGVE